MAEKSYRKATEKEIKRGAKKTTDELSKAEALKYFKKRSEDTGSKRFRWQGDVYDLEGNKISAEKKSKSSAPEKSPRPAPRSRATAGIEVTKLPKSGFSGRGDGRAEVIRRRADAALGRVKDTPKAEESKTPSTRTTFGGVPTSSPYRGQADSRREAERAAREEARERGGRVSPLGRLIDRALGRDKDEPKGDPRSRRARNMAKGGMVKKAGYANGGMVKANCGASMKPDGNRKK